MKYKFFSILVSFVMLLPLSVFAYSGTPYGGTAPVISAVGESKVEVENYDNGGQNVAYYSTRTTKARQYRTDEYVAISSLTGALGVSLVTSEWLNFTVNVEEEGSYQMKMSALAFNTNAQIDVYVDGEKQISGKKMSVISETNQYVPSINEIGILTLKKGTNVIRLENPDVFFYPDYFTLGKIKDNEPFKAFNIFDELIIEAEDYDGGGQNISYFIKDETYSAFYRTDEYVKVMGTDGGYSVELNNEEWLEYTVYSDVEDTFFAEIKCNGSSVFEIYTNDILRAKRECENGGIVGTLVLNEGKNIIKIKNTGEKTEIDNFTLKKLDSQVAYKQHDFNGEDSLKIEAEDFDIGQSSSAWYDKTVSNNGIYRYDSDVDIIADNDRYLVDMSQDEWMSYTINSEVSGSYSVWIYSKPMGNYAMTGITNGKEIQNEKVYVFGEKKDNNYTYTKQYIGECKLTEGKNKLIIKNMHSVQLYLDYIILKPNEGEAFCETVVPGVIYPHKYDVGGMYDQKSNPNGGYSSPFRYSNGIGSNLLRPYDYIYINTLSSEYYCSFQPNDWLKYTVNSESEGKYALFMKGQLSAGTGKMSVYVDDNTAVEGKAIPLTTSITKTFICTVDLKKGINKIKVESSGTSGYFFTHLYIEPITETNISEVKAVSENNEWSISNETVVDSDVKYFTLDFSNDILSVENCVVLKKDRQTLPLEAVVESGIIKVTLKESLLYNSDYTLEIKGSEITDLYGNTIDGNFIYNFSTCGGKIEVVSSEINGKKAKATVKNNGYTDTEKAVLLFALYNNDGMVELKPIVENNIEPRKSVSPQAELENEVKNTDITKLYVWNSLSLINPIMGISPKKENVKEVKLEKSYIDYNRMKLVIKGCAPEAEKVTFVVTKAGKTISDFSSNTDNANFIGECICDDNGMFYVEVPFTNAPVSDNSYNIYVSAKGLLKPQSDSVKLFLKTDVERCINSLKTEADKDVFKTLFTDSAYKTSEKLGLENPLYEKVDKEIFFQRIYEKKNQFDENDTMSVKKIYDEVLMSLYIDECKTSEELKSAVSDYGSSFNLDKAEFFGYYASLEEQQGASILYMLSDTLTSYSEIIDSFNLSVIKYMFDSLKSYNDVSGAIEKIYKYVGWESMYNSSYINSAAKLNIDKYIAMNYKSENISDKNDVAEFLTLAVNSSPVYVPSPSQPVVSPSVSGGTGSSSGMNMITYPQQLTENTQKNLFYDVTSSHWASEYILALAEKGVIAGKGDGKFYPEDFVKREEFVKLITALPYETTDNNEISFIDININEWYYNYVVSAVKGGIIKGVDGDYFGIGRNITREQMAVILYRIINKYEAFEKIADSNYKDFNEISDYAKEAVLCLTQCKILSGNESAMFLPHVSLTRAEAAKVIYLTLNYISEVKNEK